MSAVDAIGGHLPERWELTTIGDVCDRFGGEVQTGPFGSQLHAEDYVADGIPSVMPKDIINDRISSDGIARVSETDAARLAVHRLRAGDIVYARRGDIGRRALVTEREAGWLCGTGCLRIRLNCPNVAPEYLMAYLGHPALRAWVEFRAQGATMLNLNTSILRSVPLRIPPLREQLRIADILDKADAVRRKLKEAIALTEELLRSAFLEMFGDPVTNPKGWEPATVEEMCERIVDCPHTTPRYDEPVRHFACVRTSDLQGGFLDWSTTKYVGQKEYIERTARTRPVAGDVLYSREGERLGIAALVPDGVSLCLGQRMMLLRARPTSVAPEFLWGIMNAPGTYRQAMGEVGGSTSPHVNVGSVRRFKVVKPPLSEQRKFSSVYARAVAMRAKAMASSAVADELFASVVSRAFRGEFTRDSGSKRAQLEMFTDAVAE